MTLVMLAVLVVGGILAVVVPLVAGSSVGYMRRLSARTRRRVLVVLAVIVVLGTSAVLEGRVGPITVLVLAVLLVGLVARRVVPMVYATDESGRPLRPRALRLGAPVAAIALVFGVLAAVAETDPDSFSVRVAADQQAVDDDDSPTAGQLEEAPLESPVVEPEPEPVVIPIFGRYDTLGEPFADQGCFDGGPLGGEHGGGRAPKAPLDAPTQEAVDDQLDAARAFALSMPTVAHAEAAGYRLTIPYLPCTGAQYVRWNIAAGDGGPVDGIFDPAQPEILIYQGSAPDSPIVGVGYFVVSETKPSGFASGNDDWHRHRWLCLADGVFVDADVPHESCAATNQQWFSGHDLWIARAWVVEGWENPLGVFADGHGRLG